VTEYESQATTPNKTANSGRIAASRVEWHLVASACSIVIGVGITTMQPGSLEGLLMVVPDVKAVREELVNRGVDISEIDVQVWGSFAYFGDPDGNRWSLQQLPSRT